MESNIITRLADLQDSYMTLISQEENEEKQQQLIDDFDKVLDTVLELTSPVTIANEVVALMKKKQLIKEKLK